MPRSWRSASVVVVTALLVIVASRGVQAIGPSMLMFYGGDLTEPVLVFPGNPSYNPTSFIWNPFRGPIPIVTEERRPLPPNLEGRRYMSVAIFWGRYNPATAKPSDASQHARIYLRTASEPAVIVVTAPRMVNEKDSSSNPQPVPVPTSLDGFMAGWTLSLDISQWIREQATRSAK